MTEGLTINRLALNLYVNNYLNDQEIPLISKLNLFNFIYYAYYGGITEVYMPYGTNLKYYDVNYLYPYAALNNMPGLECHYLETFTHDTPDGPEQGLDLDNLFVFFYAKVKTNDQYLGLLPVKTEKGLIFPNGHFSGVWTS